MENDKIIHDKTVLSSFDKKQISAANSRILLWMIIPGLGCGKYDGVKSLPGDSPIKKGLTPLLMKSAG